MPSAAAAVMTPQRISTWTITASPQQVAPGVEPDEIGEAAHAVDRIGRAAPRRDDEPRDAELLPSPDVVRAGHGAAETDLERGGVPAVLAAQLAQARDLAGRRLERVTHADPTVAGPRRAPQRGPALAADQDRRPRLLEGLGLERNGVESEELAVVRHLRLGPEPLAHLDRLVDAPASRREVEADRPPLLLEPAGADPELDPSTGQDVERLHGAR